MAVPLDHRTKCFGYVFSEAPRAGSLDGDRARAAGARGPQLKQLKAGQNVTLDDGRVLVAADFVGATQPGKKIAVLQDSRDSSAAAPHCHGADLLIHEATYDNSWYDAAMERGHSTAGMVGEFCAQLQPPPRTVALTHISPRYVRPRVGISQHSSASAGVGAAGGSGAVAAEASESPAADSASSDAPCGVSAMILVDECETALRSRGVAINSAPAASADERTTRVILAADLLELDAMDGYRCVAQHRAAETASGGAALPLL